MTPLSAPAIAALRAMLAAATPGPWTVVRQGESRWIDTMCSSIEYDPERGDRSPTIAECEYENGSLCAEANASLVAALRNSAADMLDELERLTTERDDYVRLTAYWRGRWEREASDAGHAAAVAVHGDPLAGAVGTIGARAFARAECGCPGDDCAHLATTADVTANRRD